MYTLCQNQCCPTIEFWKEKDQIVITDDNGKSITLTFDNVEELFNKYTEFMIEQDLIKGVRRKED
jgi:hypothetical protein